MIPMQFLVVYADGTKHKLTFEVRVQATSHSWVQTDFRIGGMASLPNRNIVYLTDTDAQRMLAVDTETGQVSAVAHLIGNTAGGLVVSPDGSRLFVALGMGRLQVFSLPELHQVDLLTVPFHIASFAITPDARLYATTSESGTMMSRNIHRLDPDTGRILESFGDQFSIRSSGLRVSQDGERLYCLEALSTSTNFRIFAIDPGSPPVQVDSLTGIGGPPFHGNYGVDESNRRITISGGSIVFDPSDPVLVYADTPEGHLRANDVNSGKVVEGYPTIFTTGFGNTVVRRIDRRSGREINHVAVPRVSTASSSVRMVRRTMNGNIVYYSTGGFHTSGLHHHLGLISKSELALTLPSDSPGTMAPAVDLGAERSTRIGTALRIESQILTATPTEQLEVEWSLADGPQSVTFSDIEPGGEQYDLGPGSQATLRIPAWRYADWAAFHLPGAESEERAPGYTDEAGVPNLLRFALGVGPHPADVPRLAHGITTEQGDVAIILRFPRRRDAPDLVYEIMTSSNLVDWEPIPGPWEMIDVTTGEPGIDWITVRLSGSLSSRRAFYVLRIRLVDPLFGP